MQKSIQHSVPVNGNGQVNRVPDSGNRLPVKSEPDTDTDGLDTDEETRTFQMKILKSVFQSALLAHNKASVSLTQAVQSLIEADIERSEAIEWGLETGLSESYVRATVSSYYSQLVGRERAKGAGRKRANGAQAVANCAMRESGDNGIKKAIALCRSAMRLLEKQAKEMTSKD